MPCWSFGRKTPTSHNSTTVHGLDFILHTDSLSSHALNVPLCLSYFITPHLGSVKLCARCHLCWAGLRTTGTNSLGQRLQLQQRQHEERRTCALGTRKAFGNIWVRAPQFNLGVALTCIVPFVQCCHICHASQYNTPKNCLWAWLQPYTNKLTLVWCGQQRGEYYGVCFCILCVQWSLQIYILDVKDHSIPYYPGARPSKMDQITPISWN